uniref:WRKY domain-containing protein n=1 Tax=Physcomitrium patens TaxID=3218 RepID=A0A7I4FKW8_PHYPA
MRPPGTRRVLLKCRLPVQRGNWREFRPTMLGILIMMAIPQEFDSACNPGRSPQSRIAIQTRTEVDVIDDGYKWRKYGQKPVKNSVHPRNYYKCTTANCPVRKRVERCTDDPSHVLTTYDGTHTHPETSPQTTDGSNPPRNVGCNLERMVDEDVSTSSAPVTPLGPPRVPSNYWPVQPNGLANLLLAGSQLPDQRRWSHPAAQQIFRLQFQTQYPLLFNMLNLMRTFPRARPPLVDPRMSPRLDSRALHAAQSYAMRTASGHINQDVVGPASAKALDPQNSSSGLGPSSSVPVSFSRAQQRLLWMRQLMGESILGEQRTGQHPASDSTTDN